MTWKPKFLGHINFYVRNAERSMKWYEDVLDLHTYQLMPGRVAFMSADLEQSHEVALVELGEDAAPPREGQVGLNHMGWQYSSLDDLKEVYQRITDSEITIDHVTDHGISIGIYIKDPDGNGIEVSYELPRNQWPRKDQIFYGEGTTQGRFPGPWDEILEKQKAEAEAAAR